MPGTVLQITLSNWEVPRLSTRQAVYAAEDALICGGILRQLVMLHGRAPYSGSLPTLSSVAQHACPGCQRAFGSAAACVQHMRATGHTVPPQSPGSYEAFEEATYVPTMWESCDPVSVPCPACERTFGSTQAMAQHMRDTGHTEPIACPECQRSFGSVGSRDQHMRATGHYGYYQTWLPVADMLAGCIAHCGSFTFDLRTPR